MIPPIVFVVVIGRGRVGILPIGCVNGIIAYALDNLRPIPYVDAQSNEAI